MFQKRRNDVNIEGFVDSDYTRDRDSRKSTTAFYFRVCGNCVSWKFQLQLKPLRKESGFKVYFKNYDCLKGSQLYFLILKVQFTCVKASVP